MLCFEIFLCYNAKIARSKIVISIQRPISTNNMDSPSCTIRPLFTKKTSSFGRFGIRIPIRNLRRSSNCPRFIVGTPIFNRRCLFSELRFKNVHGCLHCEFLCSQHCFSMCPCMHNDAFHLKMAYGNYLQSDGSIWAWYIHMAHKNLCSQ